MKLKLIENLKIPTQNTTLKVAENMISNSSEKAQYLKFAEVTIHLEHEQGKPNII